MEVHSHDVYQQCSLCGLTFYMKDMQSHIVTAHMREQSTIHSNFLEQIRHETNNAFQEIKYYLNLIGTEIANLKEHYTNQPRILYCIFLYICNKR